MFHSFFVDGFLPVRSSNSNPKFWIAHLRSRKIQSFLRKLVEAGVGVAFSYPITASPIGAIGTYRFLIQTSSRDQISRQNGERERERERGGGRFLMNNGCEQCN